MNLNTFAPIIGELYTATFTTLFPKDNYPMLKLNSTETLGRFVVKLGDDGLENYGIQQGDYLIFRYQGWPNSNSQLCFVQFGDDAILRIIPDILAAEIDLITANDKYSMISTHRNQFIVTGVCYEIKRKDTDMAIAHFVE